jgi:glycosyltransferase involved in cell wall biosynthesis
VVKVAAGLVRLIRRERIDLLHANSTTAHLYGCLAADWAGIPGIWHCRDLVDLGRLEPWLIRKASVVIAISGAVSRHLQRHGALAKVVTIPNAVNAEALEERALGQSRRAEWGLDNGHFVVGMAGQLVPWKRHDLFLQAAVPIAAAIPEARFLIIGGNLFDKSSSYEESIRQLVRELGLEDKVVFAGYRSDMPAVLNSLDVLVHPPDREPLGRVILEAMAVGKPVVAVNAAGPAEIVSGGAGGLLVAAGDARGMAEAVIGLRRNPEHAAALGLAGRDRVQSAFSPASHIGKMETLYGRLLPGRPVVGMVVAEFPSLSETFILREMQALEKQGLRVVPVALTRARPSGPMHTGAESFAERVCRPSIASMVGGVLFFLATAPRRLGSMGRQALRRGGPDSGSRLRGLYRLAVAAGLARRLKAERAERIHAHFAWVTADIGKRVARLLDIPFSLSVHAWDLYTQPSDALRGRLAGADFVAVCTRQGRDWVRARVPEYPGDRLVLIRHGVFPDRYAVTRTSVPRILAVGRLEEKKGFRHLVEACRLLKGKGRTFDCVIAGEGSQRADLEKRISESGLEGQVRLVGAQTQEQLMDWYGTAMMLAVPSVETSGGDRDGLPNVILEAMAMRIPIAASEAGAIPEGITDGVQGLLTRPGDAEALAAALSRLLADDEGRRVMGENGRATVCRDFDADRNAEALAGLFRKG